MSLEDLNKSPKGRRNWTSSIVQQCHEGPKSFHPSILPSLGCPFSPRKSLHGLEPSKTTLFIYQVNFFFPEASNITFLCLTDQIWATCSLRPSLSYRAFCLWAEQDQRITSRNFLITNLEAWKTIGRNIFIKWNKSCTHPKLGHLFLLSEAILIRSFLKISES